MCTDYRIIDQNMHVVFLICGIIFFSINSRVIEGISSKSNFSSSEMIHFWQALHYKKKKTQTKQQISSTALHIEHIILRKQQLSNIFIFKKSL